MDPVTACLAVPRSSTTEDKIAALRQVTAIENVHYTMEGYNNLGSNLVTCLMRTSSPEKFVEKRILPGLLLQVLLDRCSIIGRDSCLSRGLTTSKRCTRTERGRPEPLPTLTRELTENKLLPLSGRFS